jgi:sulfide:quinone oxidoreductase
MKVIDRKGIEPLWTHNLVAIDPDNKVATFQHDGQDVAIPYDLLHVTPPMSAPDVLKASGLGNEGGWVNVDKHTTQHLNHPNVFSLGDCSSLPTSKTGAAIRAQAPVTAANVMHHLHGESLSASYDGYTSCPLVTGYGSLILAEFDYDLAPKETFPFDQGKERWSMYMMKKHLLPPMYWHGMLRARA